VDLLSRVTRDTSLRTMGLQHAVVVLVLFVNSASSVRPSEGCGQKNSLTTGSLFQHDDVSDGINTDRTFVEYIPTSYDKDTPMPVMIYFHG